MTVRDASSHGPAGDGRSDRRERIHQRLTEAALDLFADHGYEATTAGQIAAAAGVSERTFFNHFPTKLHVLYPEGDSRVDALFELIVAAPDRLSDFDVLAECGLRWLDEPPGRDKAEVHSRGRILQDASRLSTEVLHRRIAVHAEFAATMMRGLAARAELPEPTSAQRTLAVALDAVFRHAYAQWLEGDDLDAFARIARARLEDLRAAVHPPQPRRQTRRAI